MATQPLARQHQPPTTAYLTGSPFRLDGLTCNAHAWADLNDDLTFSAVHTHLMLDLDNAESPAPEEHQTRRRQHATTVLTELLTPETYLALHRADAHHRLNDAHLDVTTWARHLDNARDALRRTGLLHAVLQLEDPGHRAIGLRLAPTWTGTPNQLLTVISAIADTTP